jgi:hypothetical protein
MRRLAKILAALAAGTMLATGAFAQTAKDVRGATPYVVIENEPAPKQFVDSPLPDEFAMGIVQRRDCRKIGGVSGGGGIFASVL